MVVVGGTFPPLLDGVSLQCFVCLWLLVSGYGYRFNKSKRFHSTLFVAFLLLCIGVVIFNFKLFYMQFAVGEDLNRNHFIIEPINIAIGLYHYFVEGFIMLLPFRNTWYFQFVLLRAVMWLGSG